MDAARAGREKGGEGWTSPRPERVPRETYAPAAAARGIAFGFWGVVTTPVISAVGLVLFVWSVGGWIGEARHDLDR